MKILKCPSCGAHLKNSSGVCEYCGNTYVGEELKEDNKTVLEDFENETNKEVTKSINYFGDVYNKDYRHLRKVIGDNIGTFIFGMIMLTFCFPIGVIILISLLSKEKEEN